MRQRFTAETPRTPRKLQIPRFARDDNSYIGMTIYKWFNKSSNFKLKLQPVIRQPHALRQRCVSRLVRQVVTDVREKRALWFYRFHDFQRLLDRRMRGMRCVAQGVQKQDVEVPQLLQRFGRDLAVIGEVGGRSETETKDRGFAVDHCQRLEARAE